MVQIKKKLVVLTGAGISAESGLKTFRDSDGLWEGYDVTEAEKTKFINNLFDSKSNKAKIKAKSEVKSKK